MKARLKPQDLTGLDLAFGGDIKKLLPAMSEIPKEFHDWNEKWNQLISTWFYKGLTKLDVTPREGVDGGMAMKHIRACMASWEPSHEHKMAGCALERSRIKSHGRGCWKIHLFILSLSATNILKVQ